MTTMARRGNFNLTRPFLPQARRGCESKALAICILALAVGNGGTLLGLLGSLRAPAPPLPPAEAPHVACGELPNDFSCQPMGRNERGPAPDTDEDVRQHPGVSEVIRPQGPRDIKK